MIISEIASYFVTVCAGISCVAVAISWLIKAVKAVSQPTKTQNDRLDALEKQSADYSEKLERDWTRISNMEEGNRVSQRALLALLEHGIDGNDVDAMKRAKEELQEFLIRR